MKIGVLGNCQVRGIAECLRLMAPTFDVSAVYIGLETAEPLASADVIVVQTEFRNVFDADGALAWLGHKTILTCPTFNFHGLHPDAVYVNLAKGLAQSPVGAYQSAIVFHAWRKGLGVDQTEALFCAPVFRHLKYFDYWDVSKDVLLADVARCGLNLDGAFDEWAAGGAFAYTFNHPKLAVLGRIAAAILDRLGCEPMTVRAEDFLHDGLRESTIWPVYPDIARQFGFRGDYAFKVTQTACPADRPTIVHGLRTFIEASLSYFSVYPREELQCDRLDAQEHLYRDIEEVAASAREGDGEDRLPRDADASPAPATVLVPGDASLPPVVDPALLAEIVSFRGYLPGARAGCMGER